MKEKQIKEEDRLERERSKDIKLFLRKEQAILRKEQAEEESKRCMSCGLCFDCKQCSAFCPQEAITRYKDNPIGEVMYTHYTKCVGCHLCSLVCPTGYIKMGMGEGL